MKHSITTRLTVLTLAAAGIATPALAASPDTNAALRYWRIFSQLNEQANSQIREVDTNLLGDPSWKPDPALLAAASTVPSKLFLRAAALPECDFGIDIEADGPMALLPHLEPMRTTVKAELIEARSMVDSGDAASVDRAAATIAACYRVSRQIITGDPTLVSALVGRACFNMTDKLAGYAIATGKLNAEQKQVIAAALSGFDTSDPFRMKAAIQSERVHFLGWMRRQIETGTGPELERLLSELGLAADAKGLARGWVADRKAAVAEVELGDTYYGLVLKAWDTDNAGAALADLAEMAQSGKFGKLAQLFAPSVVKIHKQYIEARAQFVQAVQRCK